MAQSTLNDMKGALALALKQVALAGPGSALKLVWAEVVGPLLSQRSRPMRLHDGVLSVEVDPDFIAELENVRVTVCKRLNDRLGRAVVRRLQCFPKRPWP